MRRVVILTNTNHNEAITLDNMKASSFRAGYFL
jgi:hypothetical protein